MHIGRQQGDAEAQYELGTLYEKGQGVVQDYKQAFHWYKKSAEQGHVVRSTTWGSFYWYKKE